MGLGVPKGTLASLSVASTALAGCALLSVSLCLAKKLIDYILKASH